MSITFDGRKMERGATLGKILERQKRDDLLVRGGLVRSVGEVLAEIEFEPADQQPGEMLLVRERDCGVKELRLRDCPGDSVGFIVPFALLA